MPPLTPSILSGSSDWMKDRNGHPDTGIPNLVAVLRMRGCVRIELYQGRDLVSRLAAFLGSPPDGIFVVRPAVWQSKLLSGFNQTHALFKLTYYPNPTGLARAPHYLNPMLLRSVPRPNGFIAPSPPSPAPKPPTSPGWVHEIKHDGFR
jgi:hypothetical protein